jgi:hypothetical protein
MGKKNTGGAFATAERKESLSVAKYTAGLLPAVLCIAVAGESPTPPLFRAVVGCSGACASGREVRREKEEEALGKQARPLP